MMQQELQDAIGRGDLAGMEACLLAGADVRVRPAEDDSVLERAICGFENVEQRLKAIELLLKFGADPNSFDRDGGGPLLEAILRQDERSVELLLQRGANANFPMEPGETLYDYAECDYRYEIWDLHLPEEPTEEDRKTEEAWLQFLDRMALAHGKRPPDYLWMLRKAGAKTIAEVRQELGNDGQWPSPKRKG